MGLGLEPGCGAEVKDGTKKCQQGTDNETRVPPSCPLRPGRRPSSGGLGLGDGASPGPERGRVHSGEGTPLFGLGWLGMGKPAGPPPLGSETNSKK